MDVETEEHEALVEPSAGSTAAAPSLWEKFWLSRMVRLVADFGAVVVFYAVGIDDNYVVAAYLAGTVALFGMFADYVRSCYDPWYRFPKVLDTGECVLYYFMGVLGYPLGVSVYWDNPVSSLGLGCVVLVGVLTGNSVFVDAFREDPKFPRRVWTAVEYSEERTELLQFARFMDTSLCTLFFGLGVLQLVDPLYKAVHDGDEPARWVRHLANYYLQILVFLVFLVKVSLYATANLGDGARALLDGKHRDES